MAMGMVLSLTLQVCEQLCGCHYHGGSLVDVMKEIVKIGWVSGCHHKRSQGLGSLLCTVLSLWRPLQYACQQVSCHPTQTRTLTAQGLQVIHVEGSLEMSNLETEAVLWYHCSPGYACQVSRRGCGSALPAEQHPCAAVHSQSTKALFNSAFTPPGHQPPRAAQCEPPSTTITVK